MLIVSDATAPRSLPFLEGELALEPNRDYRLNSGPVEFDCTRGTRAAAQIWIRGPPSPSSRSTHAALRGDK